MKILIDNNPLVLHEKTGVAYFIYFLCRALLTEAAAEEFVLWAPDLKDDPFPQFNNKVFRNNRFCSRAVWESVWEKFGWGAIAPDIDIYHLPYVALPAPRRSAGTKLVVTVYDLAFAYYPESASDPAVFRYIADRLPEQVAQADRILAISHSTRRDLQEILAVPAEKIRVIYPGTDLVMPSPAELERSAQMLHEELHLPERYILCVGTWEPRKNLPVLMKALHRLRRKCEEQDIFLCLAGVKGWNYREAEQLIADLGLGKRIVTLGYVRREWLPLLYARALMFVYPSLYEGFGLPVLEAMTCGAPVVTSNVSSLPEAAGDAALLIDPHSDAELAAAMERLLDDAALRDRMRRQGLAHARQFSWEKAARETLAAYRETISTG